MVCVIVVGVVAVMAAAASDGANGGANYRLIGIERGGFSAAGDPLGITL